MAAAAAAANPLLSAQYQELQPAMKRGARCDDFLQRRTKAVSLRAFAERKRLVVDTRTTRKFFKQYEKKLEMFSRKVTPGAQVTYRDLKEFLLFLTRAEIKYFKEFLVLLKHSKLNLNQIDRSAGARLIELFFPFQIEDESVEVWEYDCAPRVESRYAPRPYPEHGLALIQAGFRVNSDEIVHILAHVRKHAADEWDGQHWQSLVGLVARL